MARSYCGSLVQRSDGVDGLRASVCVHVSVRLRVREFLQPSCGIIISIATQH